MDWKKWKNLKKSDWAIVGLVGIMLMVLMLPVDNGQKESANEVASVKEEEREATMSTQSTSQSEYVSYLEEKLEAVLAQMDGVGRVEVMITLSDMGEVIVEKDTNMVQSTTTEADSGGGNRTVTETSTEETTIYIETAEETYPYIQKEKMPTVDGVVIVAEGGGNSHVVSNISESVNALLSVDAHRIKVVKMCSKEE